MTGSNLFTLRQAARRAWRIGQTAPCRVVYLYDEGTMQDRAMALMGKKLTAAQALEGSFSSEGLVALAGEDANVEIALARSLVGRMDEGDARRLWTRVTTSHEPGCRQPPGIGDDVQGMVGSGRQLWLDVFDTSAGAVSPSRPERGLIGSRRARSGGARQRNAPGEQWLF